ncbi:Cullin-domain-containing protein [Armillaria nabsnona]|nr:Cullin-domain-containing protein [Armillaria nabsnona]
MAPPSLSLPPSISDLATAWAFLEEGLDTIMVSESLEDIPVQYMMSLIATIYNYCISSKDRYTSYGSIRTQPVASALYDKVLQYFTARVKSIRNTADSLQGDEQLQYYNTEWTRYWIGTRLISRVFTYLDKNWVKRQRDEGNRNIFKVSVLALVQWKAEVLDPINQKDRLVNTLLLAIERERNGQVVDQEVVKNDVASFIRLGINDAKPDKKCFDIYETTLRRPSSDSNLNYLTKVQDRMREEKIRVERYDLIPTTRTSLISVLENAFSPPYFHAIWASFQEIPEFSGVENLPALLSRTSKGQDLLRKKFEQHVEKAGLDAVSRLVEKHSELDPKTYLDALLEVHTKYSTIITQHLYGDVGFFGSLCKACIVFVNRNAVTRSKSPELVKYADRLLRKDKSVEEVDVEGALDRLTVIFNYLEDKDVFLHFYAARLSKRLIYGVSVSDESEASMISKLGKACGSEYTSKLRQMLMDARVSKDLTEQFNDATFNVMVLGSNCWLLNRPAYGFTIPREIYPMYDRFQNYYRTKHSGRKLTWLWNYSRNELRTNYLDRRYILMTSSYQMVILLLYNDHSLLSLSELVTAASIPKEIITQVVSVLVKARILVNEESEQYSLNSNFKSKKVRVNVNQPMKAEGQTEVMRAVQEDRKYVIQATIVRIMKAQKSMNNEHLVQEVIKQISQRFTPQVPNIRKAIDILLEKEYIQQLPGDTLTYVA